MPYVANNSIHLVTFPEGTLSTQPEKTDAYPPSTTTTKRKTKSVEPHVKWMDGWLVGWLGLVWFRSALAQLGSVRFHAIMASMATGDVKMKQNKN